MVCRMLKWDLGLRRFFALSFSRSTFRLKTQCRPKCRNIPRVLVSAAALSVALAGSILNSTHVLAQPAPAGRAAALQDEFGRAFLAMRTSDQVLDQLVVAQYGATLERARADALKSMLSKVMAEPALAVYTAKSYAGVQYAGLSKVELGAHGGRALLDVRIKGLRRVSASQQGKLLRFVQGFAATLPMRQCRQMFEGTLDLATSNRAEQAHMAAMPLPDFLSLIAVYEGASLAELRGAPTARTLTPSQAVKVTAAYETAVAARLRKMPTSMVAQLADGMKKAPDDVVCTYQREALAAGMDLPLPERDYYLQQFVESLQQPKS